MTRPSYPLSRLDYELPHELIAQKPPDVRGSSRMLHVQVADKQFKDRSFTNLPDLLPAGTLCVMNNSKVLPARVIGRRASGGRVEVLYLGQAASGESEVLLGSNAKLTAGELIELHGGWRFMLQSAKSLDGTVGTYLKSDGGAASEAELHAWLLEHGSMPLPPYIQREAGAADSERYQTVYAQRYGSVAAPTAGLHFDDAMLERLRDGGHTLANVTLHVGLGTFAPLRVEDLAQHVMHSEAYSTTDSDAEQYAAALAAGKPVMAVGTTSLRVLHTIHQSVSTHHSGSTDSFIYPGHGTHAADLLLTNFHLPRSTLLALVYAFGGERLMRSVYHHAVEQEYRFFSYGDCMLIDRRGAEIDETGTVRE